jgi:hypothetical protein
LKLFAVTTQNQTDQNMTTLVKQDPRTGKWHTQLARIMLADLPPFDTKEEALDALEAYVLKQGTCPGVTYTRDGWKVALYRYNCYQPCRSFDEGVTLLVAENRARP